MDKQFWDSRYSENETVYGTEPNTFFKTFIDGHKEGNLLLPAEGEGRNAVYAAKKGWKVNAFDFSEVAREKALKFAVANEVSIEFDLLKIEDYEPIKMYHTIALIFVHLEKEVRKKFHTAICNSLQPSGYLIIEAYSKKQLSLGTGGPKNVELLYDMATLMNDFNDLKILQIAQTEITLNEGSFHNGPSSVIRMVAQKS